MPRSRARNLLEVPEGPRPYSARPVGFQKNVEFVERAWVECASHDRALKPIPIHLRGLVPRNNGLEELPLLGMAVFVRNAGDKAQLQGLRSGHSRKQ